MKWLFVFWPARIKAKMAKRQLPEELAQFHEARGRAGATEIKGLESFTLFQSSN